MLISEETELFIEYASTLELISLLSYQEVMGVFDFLDEIYEEAISGITALEFYANSAPY